MNGEDGAMPLTRPPGVTRRLRDGITFLFVRADWISSAAGAIRRRPRPELTIAAPGARFWLLLFCAIFDCAWLAAWLLVAFRFHSTVAIMLASFPVLKWLLLLVARQPAESKELDQSSSATAMTEVSSVFQATSRHGAA